MKQQKEIIQKIKVGICETLTKNEKVNALLEKLVEFEYIDKFIEEGFEDLFYNYNETDCYKSYIDSYRTIHYVLMNLLKDNMELLIDNVIITETTTDKEREKVNDLLSKE